MKVAIFSKYRKLLLNIILFLLIFCLGFFSRELLLYLCISHDMHTTDSSCWATDWTSRAIEFLYIGIPKKMLEKALSGNLSQGRLEEFLYSYRYLSPYDDRFFEELYKKEKEVKKKLFLASILAQKNKNVLGMLEQASSDKKLTIFERGGAFLSLVRLYQGDKVICRLLERAKGNDAESVFHLSFLAQLYFFGHQEDPAVRRAIDSVYGKKLEDYLKIRDDLIRFWEERTVQERNEILLSTLGD